MKIHLTTADIPENVTVHAFVRIHSDDQFGIATGIWNGDSMFDEETKHQFYDDDIIVWSGAPMHDVPLFEALLEALKSGRHWCERDHMIEDWMHRMALRLVVDGCEGAKEIAALALKTRELDFSRYYS